MCRNNRRWLTSTFDTDGIAIVPANCHVIAMGTQYLTDEAGRKVAVVLPVEDYDGLMEDVADLAAVAERRGEPRVSLEEVKSRLIADGLLPG